MSKRMCMVSTPTIHHTLEYYEELKRLCAPAARPTRVSTHRCDEVSPPPGPVQQLPAEQPQVSSNQPSPAHSPPPTSARARGLASAHSPSPTSARARRLASAHSPPPTSSRARGLEYAEALAAAGTYPARSVVETAAATANGLQHPQQAQTRAQRGTPQRTAKAAKTATGGAVTPTTGRPQRASRAGSGSAGRAPVGAVGGESGEGVSTTAAVQHPVGVAGGRRGRKRNKGGRAPTEATEQAVRRHEISPVEAFKTQALRKVGDQALEYTHTISQAAYALDVRHRRLATPPAATVEQTKAALKRVFDGGPYRTDVTPVPAHTFDEELEDYFSTDWGEEGVDLINMWWIDRRDRLPYLSAVARDVLGVNATSAACERVFSLARLFVTRLRCSMSDESVATCVLLHQWRKFLYGVEEEGPEGAQTARTEEETQTDLEEVSEYLQAWALRPGP
eukprot:GHVU01067507.1.p1 GENE.GHVU01067507.1~~GHVU01067507.1.p1  ORF type:complete len:488 (+),score=44.05 GHVU01067507.1:117-1466(+)